MKNVGGQDTKFESMHYSPDIEEFSFEGSSYFFGLLASIVVAPIRIVSRVCHMLFLLPANLVKVYLNYLMVVSFVWGVVGAIELLVNGKWPLLVSQLVILAGCLVLRRVLIYEEDGSDVKQLDINTEEVEEICNEIYEELDSYLGKEE